MKRLLLGARSGGVLLLSVSMSTAMAIAFTGAACGGVSDDSLFGNSGSGGGGQGTTSSSTTTGAGAGAPITASKIDLLLVVDNGRSMADEQQVLAVTIPDLVTSLLNPACLDANGQAVPTAEQPAGPLDACPTGSKRTFQPVLDVHLGVVSSSLGDAGANACATYPATDSSAANGCPTGQTNVTEDDRGHLLSRQSPCDSGASYPTYDGKGFLAWDPSQKLMPPGDDALAALGSSLQNLVLGVGQIGCGFHAQNESWYRFLVDPAPFATVAVTTVGGALSAQATGVDSALLQQRKDFLRPDSLLAIVVMSNENDDSIKDYGQYFYVAEEFSPGSTMNVFHLPRARSVCATEPANPCCLSCGQLAPPTCPTDPACDSPTLTSTEDPINLRKWDSKRRFGIEFYYQPDRYVDGLTRATVADSSGNLEPNPIFSGSGPTQRDPSLVFLTEIVGVPWQDIARQNAAGQPDLIAGLDAAKAAVGGFKSYAELATADGNSHSVFDYVLGDYATFPPGGGPATIDYGVPLDPLMIESLIPRQGINYETGEPFPATDPITGVAIAPAGSPVGTNPINGHEWIDPNGSDIQYACIFDLPQNAWLDCSVITVDCDCTDPMNDNPLCDPNPVTANTPTLQTRAKAYPGLKEVAIVEGMKSQGILGSLCVKQLDDPTKADYGYRPTLTTLVGAMAPRLAQ